MCQSRIGDPQASHVAVTRHLVSARASRTSMSCVSSAEASAGGSARRCAGRARRITSTWRQHRPWGAGSKAATASRTPLAASRAASAAEHRLTSGGATWSRPAATLRRLAGCSALGEPTASAGRLGGRMLAAALAVAVGGLPPDRLRRSLERLQRWSGLTASPCSRPRSATRRGKAGRSGQSRQRSTTRCSGRSSMTRAGHQPPPAASSSGASTSWPAARLPKLAAGARGGDHGVEGVGRRRLGQRRNFAAEGHKRLVSGLLDERGEAAARGEDAASGQVEGELAAFICDNRQGNEAHQARRPHR